MKNKWYKTDDLQWCKLLEERKYKFIQALWIDTCPTDIYNDYCVLSGVVDLDDWTEEDTLCAISSYYESFDQMLHSYHTPKEKAYELDEIIAECIFETFYINDSHSHGTFSEDAAVEYIEKWIEDN